MFKIRLNKDMRKDADILSRWKLPPEKSNLPSWNIHLHSATQQIEDANELCLSKAILNSQDKLHKHDVDFRIDVNMEDEGHL